MWGYYLWYSKFNHRIIRLVARCVERRDGCRSTSLQGTCSLSRRELKGEQKIRVVYTYDIQFRLNLSLHKSARFDTIDTTLLLAL